MDEKHSTAIREIVNQKGFTLVELIVVVAIIGLLTAMGTTYYTHLQFRSADSQAYVEGRNLLTAVNDAFLGMEDINFGDGLRDITGPVGNRKFSNNNEERPPIFNLSPTIRARLIGQSTTTPGGGYFEAEIWSVNGTNDGTDSGRKEYRFLIVEDAGLIQTPGY